MQLRIDIDSEKDGLSWFFTICLEFGPKYKHRSGCRQKFNKSNIYFTQVFPKKFGLHFTTFKRKNSIVFKTKYFAHFCIVLFLFRRIHVINKDDINFFFFFQVTHIKTPKTAEDEFNEIQSATGTALQRCAVRSVTLCKLVGSSTQCKNRQGVKQFIKKGFNTSKWCNTTSIASSLFCWPYICRSNFTTFPLISDFVLMNLTTQYLPQNELANFC